MRTKLQTLLPYSFMLAMIWSCQVMLIGAYDQVTDQGLQKVQDDISTLIVKLERNFDGGHPESNAYPAYQPVYESLSGQLQSLRMRTRALSKYEIVAAHVDALDSSITRMEMLHKIGFTDRGMLIVIRKTFEAEFRAVIQLQNGLKRKRTDK
jgi:hypothetical protein